ncbi:DUF2325 domain-containing protein [Thiobaca trueperi]|uniref:Uncharacterized protein DUF2325 n=1 Tax=Thiobaca trueperi TaxID=127458 RepID=A0A4R3MVT6_9GAMM|nr:DUF2325 domain-containing protein [Thiobaca trueperi]TCT17984.1 uncharacterized protein DUF2325 [Thiobaca trueperi]
MQQPFTLAGTPETQGPAALAQAMEHAMTPQEAFDPAASAEVIEILRRPQPPLAPVKSGRRKLWDVPHKYHCPIIGTCLTVAELRRIGERHAWRTCARPTDYEIHISFVSAASERNSLSLATQKLLEKKYAATVKRYDSARTPEALIALWSESLASGEVPGALWALMTHPRADQSVLVLAYEDVHMLSHQIGAGQRADLKRLTETRAELARLQREFDTLQKRFRQQSGESEQRIARLETTLREREAECERLARRERELVEQVSASGALERQHLLTRLENELADAQSRLETSGREAANWRQQWESAQADIRRMDAARLEKEAECEALERLVTLHLTNPCTDCPNETCDCRADLAGRLVLCVGGRKPLVEQYRHLVARCNGRFDHHDGGLEDSHHRLEAMLAAADAVVCATDYVSHSAYYRTKRFCKRLDKPHILLGNSGLSAFALALERVAN